LLLDVQVYLCRYRDLGVRRKHHAWATHRRYSTREETSYASNTRRSASPCRSTGMFPPWWEVWHQITISTQPAQYSEQGIYSLTRSSSTGSNRNSWRGHNLHLPIDLEHLAEVIR
jgi:hypothetical protein